MPDQLHAFDLAEVNAAIAATEFAGSIKYVSTVASTNDLAREAAQSGARHGVWIADEQTAGRGRGGHTWHSAAGEGLYMTALIAPPIPMQSALRLSLRVAIAVQSAIAATCGFRIRAQIDIRWQYLQQFHQRQRRFRLSVLVTRKSIDSPPEDLRGLSLIERK